MLNQYSQYDREPLKFGRTVEYSLIDESRQLKM